jgi:hypothetical protein
MNGHGHGREPPQAIFSNTGKKSTTHASGGKNVKRNRAKPSKVTFSDDPLFFQGYQLRYKCHNNKRKALISH